MDNIIKMNTKIKDILNVESEPIGVKFIKENDLLKDQYDSSTKMIYCQLLMKEGKGEEIMITADNIACLASLAALIHQ